MQLSVLSKRTKKSKSAPPTITLNNSRSSTAGVLREGFACTLLFLPVLSISSMHAASGLFSWTLELLAFANRQFEPKTMDLSNSDFVVFLLVSEGSERRKPPAERSAL